MSTDNAQPERASEGTGPQPASSPETRRAFVRDALVCAGWAIPLAMTVQAGPIAAAAPTLGASHLDVYNDQPHADGHSDTHSDYPGPPHLDKHFDKHFDGRHLDEHGDHNDS